MQTRQQLRASIDHCVATWFEEGHTQGHNNQDLPNLLGKH